MVQAYLLDGIAGIALVVLAAAMRGALHDIEGGAGTLSAVLFGAGIAAGTVSLLQGLFTQVLADRVAGLGSRATVRALFDLNGEGDTYKLLALGVLLAATALLIIRTRAMPQWLGWLGAVLAPLLTVAGWNFLWSESLQYAAYSVLLVALLIWVAGVGVVAWRRAP
jgi:hypothetical protein